MVLAGTQFQFDTDKLWFGIGGAAAIFIAVALVPLLASAMGLGSQGSFALMAVFFLAGWSLVAYALQARAELVDADDTRDMRRRWMAICGVAVTAIASIAFRASSAGVMKVPDNWMLVMVAFFVAGWGVLGANMFTGDLEAGGEAKSIFGSAILSFAPIIGIVCSTALAHNTEGGDGLGRGSRSAFGRGAALTVFGMSWLSFVVLQALVPAPRVE